MCALRLSEERVVELNTMLYYIGMYFSLWGREIFFLISKKKPIVFSACIVFRIALPRYVAFYGPLFFFSLFALCACNPRKERKKERNCLERMQWVGESDGARLCSCLRIRISILLPSLSSSFQRCTLAVMREAHMMSAS